MAIRVTYPADHTSQLLPTQLAATLERELPQRGRKVVKLPSRRQLAERFGVSLPTVTAALKELQRRELVYWVPGKGMYSGSQGDRKGQRLFTVGVLGWFSHVGQGSEQSAADTYRLYLLGDLMAQAAVRGWQVTVIPHEPANPVDVNVVRRVSVDALILKDPPTAEPDIRALRRLNVPLISDSMKYAALGVGYVAYDNIAMVRQMVEVFASRGHKRIGYVGVDTSSALQNQLMRQQFFTSQVDAGLIYDFKDYWRVCPWDTWRATPSNEFLDDLGLRYGRELLALRERPTALFAWQPRIAAGVTQAIREAGLRMPQDISLITDTVDITATPHSTFVQPHQQLAARLLERVKDLVEDPGLRVEDRILKTFIDQGSIATIS